MNDFLKGVGLLGVLVGGYFLINAYRMGITIPTDSGGATVNLDLMAARADTVAMGGFLFLSGWLLVGVGVVADKLDNISRRLGRTAIETEEADL